MRDNKTWDLAQILDIRNKPPPNSDDEDEEEQKEPVQKVKEEAK